MTHPPKGVRSPAGLAAIERVAEITAALPEVEQVVDGHGHTSFRVRSKTFVMLGEGDGGPSLSIKADLDTQRHLVDHRGWARARYIGQHGWTTLRPLPPESWDEVAELVIDAYVLAAPKTLARRVREGS